MQSPSILENLSDEPRTPVTKNKDIMTFDIPLNETGSAGLGVSVKGKTTTTEQGAQDLGIFIKSVIAGGAAAKVMGFLSTLYVMNLIAENKNIVAIVALYVIFLMG